MSSFDYADFIKRQGEVRDKTEVVEENIASSKTEERRAYHRSYFKRSWPQAETFSPDWDKRELVHFLRIWT